MNEHKVGLFCTDGNDDPSYKAELGLIAAWNKVDSVLLTIIETCVEVSV